MKPRSDACERNRDPILKVLQQWLQSAGTVLEIGAGTGQHAAYFAKHLPHLTWIPTDREEHLAGIAEWVTDAGAENLRAPLKLDVTSAEWPMDHADYVFTANTAHIMSWPQVEAMFAGVGQRLAPKGLFCLYGPVNREGEFTSESNRAFDSMLRARDPLMGIRDDRALIELGQRCALTLVADTAMPASNRLLIWSK
jgi:SAM-dependent methyltransferase